MLNKHAVKILKYIRCHEKNDIDDIYTTFNKTSLTQSSVTLLETEGYIKGLSHKSLPVYQPGCQQPIMKSISCSPYAITAKGIAYLEERTSKQITFSFDAIHQWINTIIAIIALVISVAAHINQ